MMIIFVAPSFWFSCHDMIMIVQLATLINLLLGRSNPARVTTRSETLQGQPCS
jgi:hypothetical protein